MKNVIAIAEELRQSAEGLATVVGGVPDKLWQTRPKNGGWSAAEVIAHLSMVEEVTTRSAARVTQHRAKPVPLGSKVQVPTIVIRNLIARRLIKRESPIPLDANLLSGKLEMMARYKDRRVQTLAQLAGSSGKDLSAYRWKHPFFGYLDYYTWFRVIGWHERRHTQQIREIVESFKL